MKPIRIFISSPGDVAEEREKAREVVRGLQSRYVGRFVLEPVLWEELPLQASMSFQEGIDLVLSGEQGIDIAVFVLWSRLGSPLGALIRKPDGSEYRSGTEREFDMMLQARAQSGEPPRPAILAYVRDDDRNFLSRQEGQSMEKKEAEFAQLKLAKQFVAEHFHDTATKTNIGAFHTFDQPITFAHRLRVHLRGLLDGMLADEETGSIVWDISERGSPFRGLQAFEAEHRDIYFGREQAICDVQLRLREQAEAGAAYVVIVGASGSGKSSLARAGVLPSVEEYDRDDEAGEWVQAIITPGATGGNLIQGLAGGIAGALGLEEAETGAMARALANEKDPGLAYDLVISGALKNAGGPGGKPARLLLLVDQMEELFTIESLAGQRETFVRALDMLARSGGVWVLATLRSDFYATYQTEPGLMTLKGGRGQIDLTPPDEEALCRIITAPASLAGLRFETNAVGKRLDRVLLETTRQSPEALPLLEFALDALYERQAVRGDHALTWADYEAMGGLEGAIAGKAEEALATLPREHQKQCFEAIFGKLLSLSSAEDGLPVRKAASQAELLENPSAKAEGNGKSQPELPGARAFLDVFVGARLLVASEGMITVVHEALLRRWDRVEQLRKSKAELFRIRRQVEQRHAEWLANGRNASLLLPEGLPVEQGRKLMAEGAELITRELEAYIIASIGHHEAAKKRRSRLTQSVIAVLSLLLVLAVAAGVYAMRKQKEAEAKTREVEIEKANTQKQLEKARIEEGYAWLERAKKAENAKDTAAAMMFAAKAVGFAGYGRDAVADQVAFDKKHPILLTSANAPEEFRAANELIQRLQMQYAGVALPVWSSPKISGSNPALHSVGVYCVAFSPDGRLLASGSDIKTSIEIWDAATGIQLASLSGHSSSVVSIAFSPDGTRLASGSLDDTIKIWDVATWLEKGTLSGHSLPVKSVAFNPSGTLLASGSWDETVKIWEVATGLEKVNLSGKLGPVNAVAFSPDGTQVAIGSLDKTLTIWDLASGSEKATLSGHSSSVNSVAFSPDGTCLASGSADGSIKIWDVKTAIGVSSISTNFGGITSISFSPDGTRIASGGDDNIIKIWDLASGLLKTSLSGHSSSVQCLAFSLDGTRFASGSRDQTIKVWDVSKGVNKATLSGHSGFVRSVAFSPNGTLLASSSHDNTIKIWDVLSGVEKATLSGHSNSVSSLAFSPDGGCLASGSEDNSIKFWDLATGIEKATLWGHSLPVFCVAFCPNGKLIASGSEDHSIKFWDVSSGVNLATLSGHSRAVRSVAFSPDGTLLASSSYDKTIKIWDAASGLEKACLQGHSSSPSTVVFSPDGTLLASESGDQTIKIWDIGTHREKATLYGHSSGIGSLAISPDGSLLASGSAKSNIEIWDVATGVKISDLCGHRSSVSSISYNADGTLLASASWDRTIKIWDIASRAELGLAELVEDHSVSVGRDGLLLWGDLISVPLENTPRHNTGLSRSNSSDRFRLQIARGNWDLPPDIKPTRAVDVAICVVRENFSVETKAWRADKAWQFVRAHLEFLKFNESGCSLSAVSLALSWIEGKESPLGNQVLQTFVEVAPEEWWSKIFDRLAEASESKSADATSKVRWAKLAEQLATRFPANPILLAGWLKVMPDERQGSELMPGYDRLVALPNATADHWFDAIYNAANANDRARFERFSKSAQEAFPNDAEIPLFMGWSAIAMGDDAAALRAFQRAANLEGEKAASNENLQLGLACAQWLTKEKEAAIESYLVAIKLADKWADRKQVEALGWSKREMETMLAVLDATLAAHPELRHKPQDTKSETPTQNP